MSKYKVMGTLHAVMAIALVIATDQIVVPAAMIVIAQIYGAAEWVVKDLNKHGIINK
tara:strand:- start:1831 stop:2001 length:171 start_codon:yes stop_codon:yes gene_type:complete